MKKIYITPAIAKLMVEGTHFCAGSGPYTWHEDPQDEDHVHDVTDPSDGTWGIIKQDLGEGNMGDDDPFNPNNW